MKESNADTTTLSDAELAAKAQEDLNMEGEMDQVRRKVRLHRINLNLLKYRISFSQLIH